jgi:hypothetical protein
MKDRRGPEGTSESDYNEFMPSEEVAGEGGILSLVALRGVFCRLNFL